MAEVGISTVIGTAGDRLVKDNNISGSVRRTTKPVLSRTYTGLGRYTINSTIVASKCLLETGCVVRTIKPG